MKAEKQYIEIEGYKIEQPKSYPVSWKEFLRIVVGGSLAKARSETERMHYMRNFLTTVYNRVEAGKKAGNWADVVTENNLPVDQRIKNAKAEGFFDQIQFDNWAGHFLRWRKEALSLSERARKAAHAKHEKNNPLTVVKITKIEPSSQNSSPSIKNHSSKHH